MVDMENQSEVEGYYRAGFWMCKVAHDYFDAWFDPDNPDISLPDLDGLKSTLQRLPIRSNDREKLLDKVDALNERWKQVFKGPGHRGANAAKAALRDPHTYCNREEEELRLPKLVSETLWHLLCEPSHFPSVKQGDLCEDLHHKLSADYKPHDFQDVKKQPSDEDLCGGRTIRDDPNYRPINWEQIEENIQEWFLDQTESFLSDQESWSEEDLSYVNDALHTAFEVIKTAVYLKERPPTTKKDDSTGTEPVVIARYERITEAVFTVHPVYDDFSDLFAECVNNILASSTKTAKHWFTLGIAVQGEPPQMGSLWGPRLVGGKDTAREVVERELAELGIQSALGIEDDAIMCERVENELERYFGISLPVEGQVQLVAQHLETNRQESEESCGQSNGTEDPDARETPAWVSPCLTDAILRMAWELHKRPNGLKPKQLKEAMGKRLDKSEGQEVLTDESREEFWSQPSKFKHKAKQTGSDLWEWWENWIEHKPHKAYRLRKR